MLQFRPYNLGYILLFTSFHHSWVHPPRDHPLPQRMPHTKSNYILLSDASFVYTLGGEKYVFMSADFIFSVLALPGGISIFLLKPDIVWGFGVVRDGYIPPPYFSSVEGSQLFFPPKLNSLTLEE